MQLGTAEQQAQIAFSSLQEFDSGALGLPSVGFDASRIPSRKQVINRSRECVRQLPLTNDPRHSVDAGSAAGATDGTEG